MDDSLSFEQVNEVAVLFHLGRGTRDQPNFGMTLAVIGCIYDVSTISVPYLIEDI